MNLATATAQELFNAAVRGLDSQGWKQATDGLGDCLLRGECGLKCAIGWCIDDADYRPAMEKHANPRDLLRYYNWGASRSNLARECSLLLEMQDAHDRCADPEQMRESFINLAADFNLTWPADVEKPNDLP